MGAEILDAIVEHQVKILAAWWVLDHGSGYASHISFQENHFWACKLLLTEAGCLKFRFGGRSFCLKTAHKIRVFKVIMIRLLT